MNYSETLNSRQRFRSTNSHVPYCKRFECYSEHPPPPGRLSSCNKSSNSRGNQAQICLAIAKLTLTA